MPGVIDGEQSTCGGKLLPLAQVVLQWADVLAVVPLAQMTCEYPRIAALLAVHLLVLWNSQAP